MQVQVQRYEFGHSKAQSVKRHKTHIILKYSLSLESHLFLPANGSFASRNASAAPTLVFSSIILKTLQRVLGDAYNPRSSRAGMIKPHSLPKPSLSAADWRVVAVSYQPYFLNRTV